MSKLVSYMGAFGQAQGDTEQLTGIEIPLIQRDYAQGRENAKVNEIRKSFLNVLFEAVGAPEQIPASLDFVYGEIESGTLKPLDGQQRLTTLFLLHWYLAVRSGNLEIGAPWTRFSYATRPSARRFCERLVGLKFEEDLPPMEVDSLSGWITDQSWYLSVWRYDPTVQAMLVMLDAIHTRFSGVNPKDAWERLEDLENPAIVFHLLPIPDMGSAEDLYIKMNSRGKPLTEFENFKAHFETTIGWSARADDLAQRIDTQWLDLLWPYRGEDDLVDDEFMRYFRFVTEICEWSDPAFDSKWRGAPINERAEQVFGAANPHREQHLDFLFQAFNVWADRNISSEFAQIFTAEQEVQNPKDRIPLFFRDKQVDLFASCCRHYGGIGGGTSRDFSLGQTLLLLAVITHLVNATDDFQRRIRVLRNLVEGSSSEIRADRMPQLIADARSLILAGQLPEPGASFSAYQIDDEQAKERFLIVHPDMKNVLATLEDHELLRGSLSAFELDPIRLKKQSETFQFLIVSGELWSAIAGALLTFGDYQRKRERGTARSFQFAPPSDHFQDAWRHLLVGETRENMKQTRKVFGEFLDAVGNSENPLEQTLNSFQENWLVERQNTRQFDWRYYFVKYPSMRAGGSGIYFALDGRLGYYLCNLQGNRTQLNSWYRDPYLLTIWDELGRPESIMDPWFQGYEYKRREMRLASSGLGLGSFDWGLYLSEPTEEGHKREFLEVPDIQIHEGVSILKFVLDGRELDGERIDTEDRIEAGVKIVQDWLAKGY